MNPTTNTMQALNGFFKERYADKVKNLVPENVVLMNLIKFNPKKQAPGNLYHQPVILRQEHGVTFGDAEADAINLNAPISGGTRDATIRGHALVLRSQIGYKALSSSAESGAAFETTTKHVIANMLRSMAKKLEIELLYGQVGYGVVSNVTSNTVTISTAEWASEIWAGAEGMPVEFRSANGATSRGNFQVTSVNLDARTVTLDANVATAGVIATDVIWHKGAFGNEFAGIHRIITQSTGLLFGIDVTQYNLFRGNVVTLTGGSSAQQLDFSKITKAATRGLEKGQNGKLVALVNPRGWADIMNAEAAKREYDGSYDKKELENGSQVIKFYSLNGLIEIRASTYVKEGYAYLLAVDDFMRVGSSDVEFMNLGAGENEYFMHRPDSMAVELRLYTDQALFCCAPGHQTLISGIINS